MNRSITALIKNNRGFKPNKFSKNTISQIQKLVKKYPNQIYPHEILMIYNHLCHQQDEAAFKALDHLFFPMRSDSYLIQPSLALSYRRLYCLAKYKAPFGSWIGKLRQLVHESKLNDMDFKYLFKLAYFQSLRFNEDYIRLYDEIISILDEQSYKFHTSNLSGIYNIIAKNTIKSEKLRQLLCKMEKQIDTCLPYFFFQQIKYLYNARVSRESWMLHYFAKSRGVSFSTFGFLQIILSRQHQWKQWVLNKYSKQSIIDKLPTNTINARVDLIIQNLFSNCSMNRSYIDQFFQFKKSDNQTQQAIELANPAKDYDNFLLNAFYYLDSDLQQISRKDLRRINHVVHDLNYSTKTITAVCLYLTVRLHYIYFLNFQKERRQKEYIQLIKACLQLLNRCPYLNQSQIAKHKLHHRLLPTKSIKLIATMEFQVYKTPEFKQFYDKLLAIYHQIYANFATGMYPSQHLQIQNIIKQYIENQKPKQTHLFFGEMKKIIFHKENLQVQLVKNVEVNFKTTVMNLIKIKDIKTGKQNKFLIDFKKIPIIKCDDQMRYPIKNYWKKKYLTEWCGLNYVIQPYISMQQYLESEKFKAHTKKLLE